jgi:hypothetical protein
VGCPGKKFPFSFVKDDPKIISLTVEARGALGLSSILNALKKLEKEFPQGGSAVPLPRRLGTKKFIRRWEIHSGRFAPALWVCLALVVLATAGWFVFYLRQPPDIEPGASRLAGSEPAAASPAPAARRVEQTPPPVDTPPKPTPPPTLPRRPPSARRFPGAAGTTPGASGRPRAAPRPALPVKPPPAVLAAPAGPKTEAAQTVEIPELSADLKLQAISWSKVPEDRIAVINGTIVREGMPLEGYTVYRIDEEQVVVSKGGGQWKLVFNLK